MPLFGLKRIPALGQRTSGLEGISRHRTDYEKAGLSRFVTGPRIIDNWLHQKII
jgi:hypothetical protein